MQSTASSRATVPIASPGTAGHRPAAHAWAVLILVVLLAELAVLAVGVDDLDEGYFAAQAVRVLHGQVPYRDFDSLYTPGLLVVHAGIFALAGGPSSLALRLVALGGRAALAGLLYALTRPMVRHPGWAVAPAMFVLVGLDAAPDRWEPHPGWLSTAFGLLAVWWLSRGATLAGGAAAGLAFAFKQNAGLFVLGAIELWLLLGSGCSGRWSIRGRLGRLGPPLVGFLAVTAAWLLPLSMAIGGQFDRLAGFIGLANRPAALFSPPEPLILLPLGALGAGLVLARRDPDPRLRGYLLAGACLFLTQYPRMDTLHLAWSAPLLLAVGAAAVDRLRPLAASLVALGLLLATLPTLTWRVRPLLQPSVPISGLAPVDGLRVPEPTRAELTDLVDDLRARTSADEPIFVYPSSPLVYVLADRPNPTRFDHVYPGAASRAEVRQLISDLVAARVRLVVVSDFWHAAWGEPGDNQPLEDWLASHFQEVARHGAYRVLVGTAETTSEHGDRAVADRTDL